MLTGVQYEKFKIVLDFGGEKSECIFTPEESEYVDCCLTIPKSAKNQELIFLSVYTKSTKIAEMFLSVLATRMRFLEGNLEQVGAYTLFSTHQKAGVIRFSYADQEVLAQKSGLLEEEEELPTLLSSTPIPSTTETESSGESRQRREMLKRGGGGFVDPTLETDRVSKNKKSP